MVLFQSEGLESKLTSLVGSASDIDVTSYEQCQEEVMSAAYLKESYAKK